MRSDLHHKRVAFTGKLASMSHTEAAQIICAAGARLSPQVSRWTSVLVVGMHGFPLRADGSVSCKLQRAEQLIRKGYRIKIIPETAFLELVGLQERRTDVYKAYPAETICELVDIPGHTLRRWEQYGLIRSDNGLYSFQDLVSLQTVAALIKQGVTPQTINSSIAGLSAILPDTRQPLAQLKIVVEHTTSLLAEFPDFSLAADGQMILNFEARSSRQAPLALHPAPKSAEDLFETGQRLEEAECYLEARRCYERAIALRPEFAEACFNLGNVLRTLGDGAEAETAYRTAVTIEPGLADAWYNLADLQEEHEQLAEAANSLRMALHGDPQHADAHFNLALCYEKSARLAEAKEHWSAYLKLDPDSEWAETARQHLQREESGLQT